MRTTFVLNLQWPIPYSAALDDRFECSLASTDAHSRTLFFLLHSLIIIDLLVVVVDGRLIETAALDRVRGRVAAAHLIPSHLSVVL